MKRAALLLVAVLAGCNDDAACSGANCVPQGQARIRYAVEMTPPGGSSLVRQQLADLPTDADGHTSLTFSAPAVVTGRVYVGSGDMPSVAAHITAVASGTPVIPGRPLTFQTTSTAGALTGSSSYTLALAPGSYNLQVTPDIPDLPPLVVPISVEADKLLDIVLPADLITISGHVLLPIGQGVPGMKVTVHDGDRVVSTTAVTDAGGGFAVRMPRVTGTYTIFADPSNSTLMPVPTVTQQLVLDGSSNVPTPFLVMPHFTLQQYTYHVVARAASGLESPASGVQLTFQTTLIDPDGTQGSFQASGRTDSSGSLDVFLADGELYTVTVQTSADSAFASALYDHYSPDQSTLELLPKAAVSGVVLGGDGKPVAGAVVQAVPTTPDASATQMSTGSSDLTDANGRFRVLLDPGTYDLEAVPPDGSSYPHWALEAVEVDTQDLSRTIQLPPASRIDGRVSGPTGQALKDVDVRVYLVSQNGLGRLRGQAHTDASGQFQLVLGNPQH